MNRLTESMDEITKASEETAKIIKTIDEIAFQTNLLALNAAVEAARAGEAGQGLRGGGRRGAQPGHARGRGGQEHRRPDRGHGEEGQGRLGAGEPRPTRPSSRWPGSSAKVAELVAEIAAASNEQAQGIDQINTAVTEMDKVTQQNAANAEESASAAEEMSAQAETMKGMVGELVAIVGSAGKGHEGAQADGRMAGGRLHTAVASAKKKAASKAGSGRKAAKPAAEATIPLDQSEELSSF